MEQFRQFTNGKGLFIGVDFGRGNDFAVENYDAEATRWKREDTINQYHWV